MLWIINGKKGLDIVCKKHLFHINIAMAGDMRFQYERELVLYL